MINYWVFNSASICMTVFRIDASTGFTTLNYPLVHPQVSPICFIGTSVKIIVNRDIFQKLIFKPNVIYNIAL